MSPLKQARILFAHDRFWRDVEITLIQLPPPLRVLCRSFLFPSGLTVTQYFHGRRWATPSFGFSEEIEHHCTANVYAALHSYWRDSYKRTAEKKFNLRFPQFTSYKALL